MDQTDRESRCASRGLSSANVPFPAWIFAAASMLLPAPIRAQEGDTDAGREAELRDAGDEARFRIIDRFPEDSDRGEPDRAVDIEVSERLRRALRDEKWERASELLEGRLGELDERLRFLRAYLFYRRGKYERAVGAFRSLREELPQLADYSAYFGAASARELGRHHDAVLQAAKVPPESRLYPDALHALADSLLASGTDSDWARARQVIDTYLAHPDSGAYAAKLRLKASRELLDRKRWGAAARRLFGILKHDPLSSEAQRAVDLLEEHRDDFSEAVQQDIDERPLEYRTAYFRTLFERHRSKRVIEELGDEISAWTPGSRGRCRGTYWLGKSKTKLRRHAEAAEWYEKILEHCRGVGPFERRALYLGGKSYWNTGDRDRALELFEQLYSRFSEHSFADDAMYFSARIFREQDRPERAVSLLRRQVDRYPDGDMAADAHWLLVRRWIEENDDEKVVSYVDELDQTGEEDPAVRGRLRYFAARAHQRRGRHRKAKSSYRRVASEHPLDYYALLALNRLARMEGAVDGPDLCATRSEDFCAHLPAGAGDDRTFAAGPLPDAVRRAAAYEKGTILLSIGLREWAGDEFQRLLGQIEGQSTATLTVADLLHRAGVHSVSYSIPDRIEGWRESYPGSGNRTPWRIAFPRAFTGEVEQWSDRHGVPASLAYALIRKESGFAPTAESWANARGLMQLMWETAQGVAEEIDLSGLTRSDLFDPTRNLRLGTAYLGDLSERFGRNPVVVAAGYNGGEGNVSAWLERRGDLPLDLWVEEIPYGQTRRYAKVAAAYYWSYRWIYDGDSVPRIAFDLSGAADTGEGG